MFGMYDTLDTEIARMPAMSYGLDRVYDQLMEDLKIYNGVNASLYNEFCDRGTDNLEGYGAVTVGAMQELDEEGIADPQKSVSPANIGYPLKRYGFGRTFTQNFLKRAAVADVKSAFNNAQLAYEATWKLKFRTALFYPTNSTWVDKFGKVPTLSLPVKAFYNADSFPVAIGPEGQSFTASTHTHYHYADSTVLTEALVTSMVSNLREHNGMGNGVVINIPSSAETAVRAFVGFTAVIDPGVAQSIADTIAKGTLTFATTTNRKIGRWNGADVWVREWVPDGASTGWVHVYSAGSPGRKPLYIRDSDVEPVGLFPEYEEGKFGMNFRQWTAYFGIAPKNRMNSVLGYWASGAAAYVAPTLS